MSPTKPALTLLLLTTLGAPHLGVPGQLAGWGEHLASEMWVSAQSPQPTTTAPTLKVYSRETIVDVTVTDAKGNPVHGLTQSDFTVKEDNKPQPIRSFEEFGNATPTTAQPLPKLPPNVYANLQPPPASRALNILLLDGLNTAPPDATDPQQVGWSFSNQTRVKQGAAQYLKSMPPRTRVTILGLSRGLRVLQGTSSDPALLSAAVDTMDINMDGRATTPVEWSAQQDMRNRMTLEALGQIAASASAIKGKKNLIWFSAGFPTITDPNTIDPGPTPNSLPRRSPLPDYTPDLHKAYSLLAAAQVAVYPVGARVFGSAIANPVGPPGYLIDSSTPYRYETFVAEEQQSFEAMAEATGGKAYYNSNDLAGLVSQAISKGSDYYAVSYVPPGTEFDGRHHTIKVEVDQPGLHLTYRDDYYAEDPTKLMPAPGLTLISPPPTAGPVDMSAAMGRSMPTSQQLLFDVQVEPSTEPAKPTDPAIFGMLDLKLKDKPLTRYGFQFVIPGRQIAFADGPNNTRHASLEFDLAAYDADGKLISSLSQSINLPLTADQAAQLAHSPFRFFQQLDLPSGQLFLRIGILDPASSKIGTLEIPLTIPKK